MTNHEILSALSLIPWFHAYGFITTFTILALRIKIVYLTTFEPQQYLETIQKYKVSYSRYMYF